MSSVDTIVEEAIGRAREDLEGLECGEMLLDEIEEILYAVQDNHKTENEFWNSVADRASWNHRYTSRAYEVLVAFAYLFDDTRMTELLKPAHDTYFARVKGMFRHYETRADTQAASP